MERKREELRNYPIPSAEGEFTLLLEREDFSDVYPGMARFTVSVSLKGAVIARFRTNTYEYAPNVSLTAEAAAHRKADAWEQTIRTDPKKFILSHQILPTREAPHVPETDVVIFQGSPRAHGNCAILAGWVEDAAEKAKKTVQIIYPYDRDIHHCIGCYQCYNTGSCVFHDDMPGILTALRKAKLVVVCTPVYTNSVPGVLKTLFDRCQAYHAERSLSGGDHRHPRGLLLSVAGRKGPENFTCVTGVTGPFMRNIGIVPSGEILLDAMDTFHDVRKVPDAEERVKTAVRQLLSQAPPHEGPG